MEEVVTFYDHLVYFTTIWYRYFVAIWYILWSFGIFFPVLVRKIWQPCTEASFLISPLGANFGPRVEVARDWLT
jgi:hypothetical protein